MKFSKILPAFQGACVYCQSPSVAGLLKFLTAFIQCCLVFCSVNRYVVSFRYAGTGGARAPALSLCLSLSLSLSLFLSRVVRFIPTSIVCHEPNFFNHSRAGRREEPASFCHAVTSYATSRERCIWLYTRCIGIGEFVVCCL